MKSKTITKIILALCFIGTIALALNMVFATDVTIPTPNNGGYSGTALTSTTDRVLGVVSYICYAGAFIMLVVLGVKWIAAAPTEKADIKKQAVVYVVGAVLVFAAGAILQIIRAVSTNTITTTTGSTGK